MRKPTKLGYCTTCNTKIWVLDTEGRPFKRKKNYCEALVDLSDGSRGRLAFCNRCIEDGIDAEEAIQNAIDGITIDIQAKQNWSADFKEWFKEGYKDLKIIGIVRAMRFKKSTESESLGKEILTVMDHVGELKNKFNGPVVIKKRSKPPTMIDPGV